MRVDFKKTTSGGGGGSGLNIVQYNLRSNLPTATGSGTFAYVRNSTAAPDGMVLLGAARGFYFDSTTNNAWEYADNMSSDNVSFRNTDAKLKGNPLSVHHAINALAEDAIKHAENGDTIGLPSTFATDRMFISAAIPAKPIALTVNGTRTTYYEPHVIRKTSGADTWDVTSLSMKMPTGSINFAQFYRSGDFNETGLDNFQRMSFNDPTSDTRPLLDPMHPCDYVLGSATAANTNCSISIGFNGKAHASFAAKFLHTQRTVGQEHTMRVDFMSPVGEVINLAGITGTAG